MFNILMASIDEDWNVAVGENASDQFPLSRYLEHTDPVVAESLKPVSEQTLAALEDTHALFMSEIAYDEDREPYVNMRRGVLSNLRVRKGSIHFDFRLEQDFGRVPVSDREAFEQALSLGKWELTRTHWAVKGGDLDEALRILGLPNSTSPTRATSSFIAPISGKEDKLVASDLESYLKLVLGKEMVAGEGEDVFYRGHSDHRYHLEPSLFRKNGKGGYRHLRSESAMVRELLTAHPADFLSDPYMIDRLVRMQHYGLPTRMLDVTSNPLVGLYFCCAHPKFDGNGKEIDGEVIVMKTKREEVKFFDSDTVSCIANLAMLEDEHKESMYQNMQRDVSIEDFNDTVEAYRLLHIIAAEKPYFKDRINPVDLSRIVFIRGRNANPRISSQSGAFLLFGHEAILPETGHSSLNVQRITIRNKPDILETLRRMNIKSSTIYPGIENSSAEIARQYQNVD